MCTKFPCQILQSDGKINIFIPLVYCTSLYLILFHVVI
jgi:hypothetical protein